MASVASQRVDALIPGWQAIIEADGRRWHTRVDDFERDLERDNDAVTHGYRPVRFSWHQLTARRDYVFATLDELARLAAAGHRSGKQPANPELAA